MLFLVLIQLFFFFWFRLCWVIGSLCSDVCFQFVLWCSKQLCFVFALVRAVYEEKSTSRSTNYFRIFSLWSGSCWVIDSLCSDLCFQFCALVFETVACVFCAGCSLVCGFIVLQDLCFFFCSLGCKTAGLQEFLLFSCAPSCAFSAFLLCFSVLPRLHVLHSRGRERERVRVNEDIGGDRRRGGDGEGERGRGQTREIGEIGRGRETEREEG